MADEQTPQPPPGAEDPAAWREWTTPDAVPTAPDAAAAGPTRTGPVAPGGTATSGGLGPGITVGPSGGGPADHVMAADHVTAADVVETLNQDDDDLNERLTTAMAWEGVVNTSTQAAWDTFNEWS